MIEDTQYFKRMEKMVKKNTKQEYRLKQTVKRLTNDVRHISEECERLREELERERNNRPIPVSPPPKVVHVENSWNITLGIILTTATFFITKLVCSIVLTSKPQIQFISTNVLALQIMFLVLYHYAFRRY